MGRAIVKFHKDFSRLRYYCLSLIAVLNLALTQPAYATFKKDSTNSCINCHQTLTDTRLSTPVKLWSASVHAEVGNTCDGCHGGNPDDNTDKAMSQSNNFYAAPKEDEIVQFCGKCHRELADNFMTSQHGETGTQTCIGCHGSHTIRRISIDIINEKTCTECHSYEQPEKIKNILQNLHGKFQTSKNNVKRISGFPTDSLDKDLEKTWNQLRQVRMISHTFELNRIEAEAGKVEHAIKQTDTEIARLLELAENRKTWGYAAIGIFLLLAIATHLYNKQEE
jgi:hypothetical protein